MPQRSLIRIFFITLAVSISFLQATPAHAMKNRTIVLRAAGSGALIGMGAGVVSYPFAKSASTLVAGALVGAVVGTVYGFYLVDQRDQAFQSAAAVTSTLELRQNLDQNLAWAKNGKARSSFEVGVPFAEFFFDLR